MAASDAAGQACHPMEPYLQKPKSPYDAYKPYPVQQKLDVTDPMYNEMMAAAAAAVEQRQGPQSGPTAEEMNRFDEVKATQYGVLNRCIELVEGGLDVNKLDSEGVSLLHWSAINNRLQIARYYIGKGAHVDRVGGALSSTPLHWATREGHLQMVVLLMSYGADPTLFDGQGYTCIHLAVQFRHSAVVAYLLAKGVDVDLPDRSGMTPLMWSTHRCTGPDPTRLLLTFGASVNKQDHIHRNTALHWAVIVSNNMAVGLLLEQRNLNLNLRNAKNELAEEMAANQRLGHLAKMIQKSRSARGLDSRGFVSRLLSNREFRKWFMYAFPFYAIFAVGVALDLEVAWWIRLLILAAVIQSIRLGRRELCDEREHVCLPVGIYLATKFFMHATWFIHFWPFVSSLDVLLPFVFNSTLLTYTFWRCATMDPGKLRTSREDQIRAIVSMSESEVVKLEQFCSTCLIRKPIRSKHCTYCNVCVAKFDHHCPWVLNCVGANNQSYFVAYLFFLMGMISWCLYGVGIYWTRACVTNFEEDGLLLTAYNLYVCSPWVAWIALHACGHFVWVGMLFANQVYQVGCLGLTTNERINGTRYKHLSTAGKVASPWHRGCVLNFVDEFGCRCCGVLKPRIVDWTEQFDVDCVQPQQRTTRRIVNA